MARMLNSEARYEWERKLIEAGLLVAMLVSMLGVRNLKEYTVECTSLLVRSLLEFK